MSRPISSSASTTSSIETSNPSPIGSIKACSTPNASSSPTSSESSAASKAAAKTPTGPQSTPKPSKTTNSKPLTIRTSRSTKAHQMQSEAMSINPRWSRCCVNGRESPKASVTLKAQPKSIKPCRQATSSSLLSCFAPKNDLLIFSIPQ